MRRRRMKHSMAANVFFLLSGTITPMSGMGKLIGGFCAVFGAFTIVLPVPIIVNSFANFYRNRLWRGEVALKRRERLNQVSLVNLQVYWQSRYSAFGGN